MSHIQDRWYKEIPDPDNSARTLRVRTKDFGKGMRYKVRYLAPDGSERSKSFPDKCKRQAEAFKTKIDSALLENRYVDPRAGREPFPTHVAIWLSGTSDDGSSRTTNTIQVETNIVPFFQSHTVATAATVDAVKKWLEWLKGRGLAQSYRAQLFRQLASIMELAVVQRKIPENPCKSKEITPPKPVGRKVIPWTEARTRAIWQALPERNRIVVPLARGIGMRQGEVLGFSPDDVRRDAGLVDIQRQIRLVDGTPVFSLPKGDKTRVAPLESGVLREIDAYAELFPPVPVTLPWDEPGGRLETVLVLMTREGGKTWYGELFTATVWAGAFRTAGITRRRRIDGMHALRHLYASDLLGNGVAINELSEYLGHADAAITLKYYAHLIPSSHERARAAIGAVFGGSEQTLTACARPDHGGLILPGSLATGAEKPAANGNQSMTSAVGTVGRNHQDNYR
ncbi:tyrosine-type recombinase/integrase [Nocardia sp. IFM 10818]